MGWQEDAARRLKDRKSGKKFKLGEGDNTLRILPNARGLDRAPYLEIRMHYNVGPRKKSLRCGKNIKGEGTCWLCDTQLPKLKASEKSSYRKAADDMQCKEEMALQIAIIDTEGNWTGPKIYLPSFTLGNQILALLAKPKRRYDDPERGYNLTIGRTGTGLQTKYEAPQVDDATSVVPEEIMKQLKPFKEALLQYDEAKMRAHYNGEEIADEPDDDDDDDAVPPPVTKKPVAVAPVEVEDEDAPPPPKKSKPGPVAVPTSAVDDDEAPPPPPAKKPKAPPPPPADEGDE